MILAVRPKIHAWDDFSRLTASPGSLFRNIATNFLNYGLVLLSAFAMLPIMIRGLGVENYGTWVLARETIGYCGYLDFGIQSAVVFFSANALARRDTDELNTNAATAFWSLATLGTVLIMAGPLLAWLFPIVFKVSGSNPREVWWTVMLATVSVAIALPGDVLTAILNGSRRLDLANILDTATRTSGFVATAVCVLRGQGLIAVSLIQVAVKAISLLMSLIAVWHVAPELSLNPAHWRKECLRKLSRFGGASLAVSLGQAVSGRVDLLVVGMFLGVRMVTL
jgi:O-antigen/teichoic acid export membrane protein